eukprot:m.36013 g.36013  ORF g.36013 m.36013 type:complete len:176 (-) comp17239_c0_seq1:611-1138(-)
MSTELYDLDHNVSSVDRARAEALRANTGTQSERVQDIRRQIAAAMGLTGTSREDMFESLAAMIHGMEATETTRVATSVKFLDGLQKFYPCEEELAEKLQCPICVCEYVAEDHIVELPCSHTFHPDCCKPWLEKHNTCPVCRAELPSDDPEHSKSQAKVEEEREQGINDLHNEMFG